MKWFGGTIPAAIAAAKANQGIFIVYIYDKSDSSKLATESLENQNVSIALSSPKYVCIKMENGSNDAKQFSQIYPLIVIPSLFFISGETGVPLEVIGGSFTPESLLDKLSKIELKDVVSNINFSHKEDSGTSNIDESNEEKIDADVISKDKDASIDINDALALSLIETEAANSLASNTADNPTVNTADSPAIDCPNASAIDTECLDDRIQLAQNIVTKIQKEKASQQMDKENEEEIERRQTGYEIAKVKQKREEKERIENAKQRRKDKVDDKLAREQVKAQIAADRMERQARENSLKEANLQSVMPTASSSSPVIRDDSDVTRIKFRFPNSTDMTEFPSTSTLADVRKYLNQNPTLPFSTYELVAFMPRRIFTNADDSSTLIDLQLTPSAILIVKPRNQPSSNSVVPAGDRVMSLIWTFLAPLSLMFNYIGRLLGLGTHRRPPSDLSDDEDESPARKQHRTEGSYTTRHRPNSSYGQRNRGPRSSRTDGNIHRLNQGDSDDENNTWNGNSTQQM